MMARHSEDSTAELGRGHNVFTRVLLNIYCIGIAIMLMWKNTQAPLWICSDDELHDLH